ncbi:TPR-like protein [Linnemannia elongata AG-77]|uniref:TPR-like protein n=1 Tax=Linnemannia elongata AG-77 TaxID=1314771 RepID=A0A197KD83_9FUNG|nr:TPR-like protein [Linnemannia elongata AG-77]
MSTVKLNLKNAKEAIVAKKYDDALKWTEKVLDSDSENYMALVFSGLAHQNLGQADKGEIAFKRAISVSPDLPLAREGLINFYDKMKKWDELILALEKMLETHLKTPDGKKALATTERLIELYTTQEQPHKAIEKIQTLLPGSPLYNTLEEKPNQMETLRKLAELQEKTDSEFFDREVRLRRGRLGGGTLEQVQNTVRNELYSKSELGSTYEAILNLDPENNGDLEQKLLTFYINKTEAISVDKKAGIRDKALELASKMVREDSASALAYETLLKFTDAATPSEYDKALQEQYISSFPNTGLSKIIQAQMHFDNGESREDLVEILDEGFKLEPNHVYGYLVVCWMDHDAKDYDSGLEHATAGRDLIQKLAASTGFPFSRMRRSFELCMANCQVNISSKLAESALALYEGIIKEDNDNIDAHQGIGLVKSADGYYAEATSSYERVLALDPNNIPARSELGWIAYLQQDYEQAEERLRNVVETSEEPRALDLYRLGRIYYDIGGEYRENAEYSHTQLIAAAKLDPHCAGAFTYLGHYYREVVQDETRAEKCYQHAFSLDPREGDAGRYLSDYLLSNDSLEGAMDVYQKVIEANGKANWALSRLGFAELSRGNNLEAMGAFQKLLRNDIKDGLAWEGVAEAYQHEGRYMAALKAFTRMKELLPDSTVAAYHISRVHQRLGMYPEAIEHYRLALGSAERNQEPQHIPSLMGMAESYLEQGKEFFVSGYYGRSAESCGHALDYALQLLNLDSDLISAWKLVGDACVAYRAVPKYLHLCPFDVLSGIASIVPAETNSLLHFPAELDQELMEVARTNPPADLYNATTEQSSRALDVIFAIAGMAYKRANILNGNEGHQASHCWYDIALTYYYRYENATRKNRSAEAAGHANIWLSVAMRCLKASLQFEEESPMVWNALGVAALTTNTKISQHAFIKAIEYDPKDAVPWSNLGFLYILNSELDLALKAFTTAQTLDPSFAQAWTGQACVASLWGSDESTALYAHACESSTASILEANYGYAKGASTSATNLLVTPAFALSKYLDQRPRDVAGWNLLGLMRERFLQPEGAAECFLTAIRIMNEEEAEGSEASLSNDHRRRKMMLHHNVARAFLSMQDYAGAVEAYEISLELEGPDAVPSVVRTCKHLGAGLALYYAGELERSLQMFEVALGETEQIAGMEQSRDDVVVLLSQVLWALGGDEQRAAAKDELFRCIAQSPSHLPAIFGLSAMGLVQDDETLATAALKEILKFSRQELAEMDPEMRSDKMISQYYSLLNESKLSIESLSKSIHQSPTEAMLWRRLAEHLSTMIGTTGSTPYSVAQSNAQATKVRGWKNVKKEKLDEEHRLSQERLNKAHVMAQHSVMAAPWRREAWQVVGAVTQELQQRS